MMMVDETLNQIQSSFMRTIINIIIIIIAIGITTLKLLLSNKKQRRGDAIPVILRLR